MIMFYVTIVLNVVVESATVKKLQTALNLRLVYNASQGNDAVSALKLMDIMDIGV